MPAPDHAGPSASADAPTRRRRGRPPDANAPGRILTAARELFRRDGFGDTSIRAIAREASSSPVVVLRHFGSKEQLFLRAMALEDELGRLDELPEDDLARALLRRLLDEGDAGLANVWRALMLAGDQQEIQLYRRNAAKLYLVDAIRQRLRGRDADARANLISAQVMGLLLMLWVDENATLAALSTEELVDLYAPSLQRLVDSADPFRVVDGGWR